MAEQIVDEVNDTGVILADGTRLQFWQLGRILDELSETSLLRVLPGIRDAINVDHTSSTFKEAGRILEVMGKVQ